jgi:hypothetical protein
LLVNGTLRDWIEAHISKRDVGHPILFTPHYVATYGAAALHLVEMWGTPHLFRSDYVAT